MLGYSLSDAGSVKLENTNRSVGDRIRRDAEDEKDTIPVEETFEDLTTFQKPESENKEYRNFINFLYRKDTLKPEGQATDDKRKKRDTSEDTLNITDTPDEFDIPKPSISNDEYDNFIKELYRFDKDKNQENQEKSKREIGGDLLNVDDTPDEFVFKKPSGTDKTYDDFLENLYKGDATKTSSKVKREVENAGEVENLSFAQLARDIINVDGNIFDPQNGIETNHLDFDGEEDPNSQYIEFELVDGEPTFIPLFVYRQQQAERHRQVESQGNGN